MAISRTPVPPDDLPGPGQPALFVASEEPVPFRLTARGRRLVDPDVPNLRVVGDPAGDERAPKPATVGVARPDPAPTVATTVEQQLAAIHGPVHARTRALARAGLDRVEVARRMRLDLHTVDVMLAHDPGTPLATGPRVARDPRPGPGRAAVGTPPAPVRRDHRPRPTKDLPPRAIAAASIVATAGAVDDAGVTVTLDRLDAARVVVAWLRRDLGVPASGLRVVLRVADGSTADIVAHSWADRLDLGRDRVHTVEWRSAPTPRLVQAIVRANGADVAERTRAAIDTWTRTIVTEA